jgi:hypothetical protein
MVMFAVAPLGLNNHATDPWLLGSTADPPVALAWILLFGGPAADAVRASRPGLSRYRRPLARRTRRASTVRKPRQSSSAAGDQAGQLNVQPPSSFWPWAR